MNTNFRVFDLTRFGIEPEFTVPEAYTLSTRPNDLLVTACLEINNCRRVHEHNTMNSVKLVMKTATNLQAVFDLGNIEIQNKNPASNKRQQS